MNNNNSVSKVVKDIIKDKISIISIIVTAILSIDAGLVQAGITHCSIIIWGLCK